MYSLIWKAETILFIVTSYYHTYNEIISIQLHIEASQLNKNGNKNFLDKQITLTYVKDSTMIPCLSRV